MLWSSHSRDVRLKEERAIVVSSSRADTAVPNRRNRLFRGGRALIQLRPPPPGINSIAVTRPVSCRGRSTFGQPAEFCPASSSRVEFLHQVADLTGRIPGQLEVLG